MSKECGEKIDTLTFVQNAELERQFENNATQIDEQLNISQEDKKNTASTVFSFLKSYLQKPQEMSRKTWLENEFQKYAALWGDGKEVSETVRSIIETIDSYEIKKADLCEWKKSGKSRESWLGQQVENTAKIYGLNSAGEYAANLESSIESANRANLNQIYTQSGQINMQCNLDGFIAEQHHANTFNLDAATQAKHYRAEVLLPANGEGYAKNSVDVVIKDINTGRIVRRYQAKYGADSESTTALFEHGNYRGQRRLVPQGQSDDVANSTDIIEIDGCKSTPLSKSEAKQMQKRSQINGRVKKYKWDSIDKVQAAKAIGKQSLIAAGLSIGFQGARIAGRRIWNTISGKENPSAEKDIQDFANIAIASGASAGMTTAVAGGMTIAAKNGWLGATVKSMAKGNVIACAACIAVDNIKTLYRYGKGEISEKEAFNSAGDSVATLVGGAEGWGIGAGVGATLGLVLGPAGAFVTGVVGGMIGAIVGGQVGHAVYEGGKSIAQTVWNGVKRTCSAIASGARKVWDFLFG